MVSNGYCSAVFEPLTRVDGYLPIERHGLIGDGASSALVAADGSITWMCVPRFDHDPLCAALLGQAHGGRLHVGPSADDVVEARQYYLDDSAVLVTEQRTRDGAVVRLTDAFALRPGNDLHRVARHGAGAWVRRVEVVDGDIDLHVELEPRGGAALEPLDGGLAMIWNRAPAQRFHVDCSQPLNGARSSIPLRSGDRCWFRLRWTDEADGGTFHPGASGHPEEILRHAEAAWRDWAKCIDYQGLREPEVRRSAITLKLLDHAETGAVVAAPTSSLPEEIGGVRNWDYRYVWVRDAAFTVHAFRRIGMAHEARDFLHWMLGAVERAGRAAVLYDLDSHVPADEHLDTELEGYRGSAPVRWGNAAAGQRQNDAYGEIVDCAFQWDRESDGPLPDHIWAHVRQLVDRAGELWDVPDHGIWEIRTDDRLFTYSVAMCEVALDRGARLARVLGPASDAERWERLAARLRDDLVEHAWDERQQAFTETFGPGGGLDASVLALPLREVVAADHPRMVATTEAVVRELGSGGGLIHRYDSSVSDDGLPGEEGAFLLCTSWWIDNLALQGRIEEAVHEFERVCDRMGPVGLLPEQIDPSSGAYLGNYPQAFSHVGVLGNAIQIDRAVGARSVA